MKDSDSGSTGPLSSTSSTPASPVLSPQPTPSPTRLTRPLAGRITHFTQEDELVVRQELELAILHFLESDRPVYLERLGILFPKASSAHRTTPLRDKVLIREEQYRSVGFEKCYDLVAFHRERFPSIVELRDLAQRIFDRAGGLLSLGLSEPQVRKAARLYLDEIREELLVKGISSRLASLGDLIALHNRQGESLRDWFAGSDILLLPRYQQTVGVGSSRVVDRTVFASASEPFEVLYGPPIHSTPLELLFELKELGYDANQVASHASTGHGALSVRVFEVKRSENGERHLLYVSEGLRHIGLQKERHRPKGTEFTVQVTMPADKSSTPTPLWPLRLMTLGWILLQSSRNGTVKPGIGLGADVPLASDAESKLSTVFTTRLHRFHAEQLSEEGPFDFVNLTAIADDEAELAAKVSGSFLLSLLEHKGCEQISRLNRKSILTKTAITLDGSESEHRYGQKRRGSDVLAPDKPLPN